MARPLQWSSAGPPARSITGRPSTEEAVSSWPRSHRSAMAIGAITLALNGRTRSHLPDAPRWEVSQGHGHRRDCSGISSIHSGVLEGMTRGESCRRSPTVYKDYRRVGASLSSSTPDDIRRQQRQRRMRRREASCGSR
jgi:hypothetical protein